MLTTHDALDAVDNRVTYRQVDYWLRTRRITLAAGVHGSGHHREWSPGEVAALVDFVDIYETHVDAARLMGDGSMWQACLDRHTLRVVQGGAS